MGVAVDPPLSIVPPVVLQLNVAPLVVELPPNTTVVVVQVNSIVEPALQFGIAISSVTTTSHVLVQPLLGSVTVSVYVPGALTVGVALAPPLSIVPSDVAQLNVAPLVVELPAKVTVVVVHVSSIGEPALQFGGVISSVTTTSHVLVQPLLGSVTVNVYVPGALTVGVALDPPLSIVPPVVLQLNVAPVVCLLYTSPSPRD